MLMQRLAAAEADIAELKNALKTSTPENEAKDEDITKLKEGYVKLEERITYNEGVIAVFEEEIDLLDTRITSENSDLKSLEIIVKNMS